MSRLVRNLHTFERACQAHYRRGKRDAYLRVLWAAGVLAFFAWFWSVGGTTP